MLVITPNKNLRSCWIALAVWAASSGLAIAQPRLVVVVVVDQMRANYLEDFAHDFEHGFGRLREHGAVFLNADHDHALTETSSGNVTIATGMYPSHHGVVGNDIWDRNTRQLSGAVFDSEQKMVGAERRSGRSPWRLLRSTVGDWLRQQSPGSKVFGVSLKDRSAVFLSGQRADGAYWYDERAGNFVTSDFYHDTLPDWVTRFNAAARSMLTSGRVGRNSLRKRITHATMAPRGARKKTTRRFHTF